MHNMLVVIAPFATMLLAWPIVHFSCKGHRQRRAVAIAFIALLILWVANLILFVLLGFKWTFVYLILLSLFVPLSLYFAFMANAKESKSKQPADGSYEPVPIAEPVMAKSAPVIRADISFESCFAKAKALSAKGLWSLSATIFEESANLAKTDEDRSKALYAAMSSYLKIHDGISTKRVAATLKEMTQQ